MSAPDAPQVAAHGAARCGGLVDAIRRWIAFWDEREPPTCLALIRILIGVAVLFDLVTLAAHGATTWLWAPAEAGGAAAWDAADPPLLFRVVAPTAAGAWALWGGLALSAFCVAVGFRTGVAALAHVFFSVQAALINGPADRAIDRLIRIVLLILVLSPAGRVWSLDARLSTGRFSGDLTPRGAWARYLIVTQLVITYFSAGLAKGGTYWYPWGGYNALYLTLQDPIFSVAAGAPWLEQPLPYFATRLATAVTQMAINIADTRTWRSLPKEFQYARLPTPEEEAEAQAALVLSEIRDVRNPSPALAAGFLRAIGVGSALAPEGVDRIIDGEFHQLVAIDPEGRMPPSARTALAEIIARAVNQFAGL